jgi:hypothetical protein
LDRNRPVGGSEPVSGINPGVLAAMAEVGIDIRASSPAMD